MAPRCITLACLLVLSAVAQTQVLTDAEKQRFLREAKILKMVRLSEGVTGSRRATLSDGRLTHDAHIQTIDIQNRPLEAMARLEPGFTDSFKYNIAAYELDRMLGLGMVPVTVFRRVSGASASVTWWVDDVLMTERERMARKVVPPDTAAWTRQMWILRLFDQLIHNMDRNIGNMIIDSDWKLWMIDHTRSFRPWIVLTRPQHVERIDRMLYERLKQLDRTVVEKRLGPWLGRQQIDGLLGRSDLIVRAVEARLKEHGDSEVFFRWLPEESR